MRLIDADALPRLTQIYEFNGKRMEREIVDAKFIDNAPTIDAQMLNENEHLGREYVAQDIANKKGFVIGRFMREPIVRCKDCKQYNGKIECGNGILTEPNDFCSFGVRKEASDGSEND